MLKSAIACMGFIFSWMMCSLLLGDMISDFQMAVGAMVLIVSLVSAVASVFIYEKISE